MKKSFLEDAPTLFIQTGKEQSALFALNFARDVRHFVVRLTGGCGLMTREDAIGLKNLENALKGHSPDGRPQPRFAGFGLFGGTRMVSKFNAKVIVPGITEIFPAIVKDCPEAAFLGVIAKVGQLKYSKYGVVVSAESGNDWVTIMHPEQHSIVLLQPSADKSASWDDEFKECLNLVAELHKLDWQSLLLVYNGGGVTEREINAWAKLGDMDPDRWKVLIVNGSGRIADKYANDKEFLAAHPTVHVCENDEESMRQKLFELGAIIMPGSAEEKPLPKAIAG